MLQRLCGFVIGTALVSAAVLAWGSLAPPASAQQPVVDKFILDSTIQPVSAGELKRAIAIADSDGSRALLIQMDTPGGLVESMRRWSSQFSARAFR